MRCKATRNAKSILQCKAKLDKGCDFCGIHSKCQQLVLPNGSVWRNETSSNVITKCSLVRPYLPFWDVLAVGIQWEKLRYPYVPTNLSFLRQEKQPYIQEELIRFIGTSYTYGHLKKVYVHPERRFWFLNLIYFLGNFPKRVKILQRLCRVTFRAYKDRRISVAKKIQARFRGKRMGKLLPIMVKHAKELHLHNCVNYNDPVSQEFYTQVSMERWVICHDEAQKRSWWFDLLSAIQLLGASSSYAGENPFTRQEYPPEFILETDYKLNSLLPKYEDLRQLIHQESQPECFSFKRYQSYVKATKLFESFKEHGYHFPARIFLQLHLAELRTCALHILRSWQTYPQEERERLVTGGILFSPQAEILLPMYPSATDLRDLLLDIGIRLAVLQERQSDRITSCLSIMIMLGAINEEAHQIIEQYGLCDCQRVNL